MGKACGILVAFAFAGLMVFCGVGALIIRKNVAEAQRIEAAKSPEQRTAERLEKEQREAQWKAESKGKRLVENLVTAVLKSPSTAKFELHAGWTPAGNLEVSGHVDAQNSFGAMLRDHIDAQFSDGVKANLVYLRMGDEVLIDKK